MTVINISRAWFEDVKGDILYNNPYFYHENGRERVEVEVNEAMFNRQSQLKGWM